MSLMNRLHNAGNKHQGQFKKVLCVCSAGLLRSPTIAWVLGQEPWGFNTRAVGISGAFALIPLDAVHMAWADEIITVEHSIAEEIRDRFLKEGMTTPLHVVDIPDEYGYRDPHLVKLVKEAMQKLYPKYWEENPW